MSLCPHCGGVLPKSHGTKGKWAARRPSKTHKRILHALTGMGAAEPSLAVHRGAIASWTREDSEQTGRPYLALHRITSRISERVTPGWVGKIDGTIQILVDGHPRYIAKPLWYITPAGLALIGKGEQAPLKVGVEA